MDSLRNERWKGRPCLERQLLALIFFFVIYKIICYLLFLKFTTYLLFFFWLPGIFLPCPVFSCGMQASIVAEHRLSCLMVHGILPPWPELEPASPAMEGGFSTTRPPGKSPSSVICWDKRKAEIMARLKKQGKGDTWQDRSKWHKSLKPELSLLAQQSASKKAEKKSCNTERKTSCSKKCESTCFDFL